MCYPGLQEWHVKSCGDDMRARLDEARTGTFTCATRNTFLSLSSRPRRSNEKFRHIFKYIIEGDNEAQILGQKGDGGELDGGSDDETDLDEVHIVFVVGAWHHL